MTFQLKMTAAQKRVSNNSNESYENHRMIHELEGDNPRIAFSKAVRAYSAAEGSNRQPRLIETIIRTSRGIMNDDGLLQFEERQVLAMIKTRYRQFAAVECIPDPRSYRDARNLIKALFF